MAKRKYNTTGELRIYDIDPETLKKFRRLKKRYGTEHNFRLNKMLQQHVEEAESTGQDPLNKQEESPGE